LTSPAPSTAVPAKSKVVSPLMTKPSPEPATMFLSAVALPASRPKTT
jgi:hypothetical protein